MKYSKKNTKANWPIDLSDLIERRNQHDKAATYWNVGYLIILFSFIFGNLFMVSWIETIDESENWIIAIMGIIFFGVLIGSVLISIYTTKKRLRSFDLICPSCEKELNGKIMPILIATGNCPNCGDTIVTGKQNKSLQQTATNE